MAVLDSPLNKSKSIKVTLFKAALHYEYTATSTATPALNPSLFNPLSVHIFHMKVLVRTEKNVLFEVSSQTRIPRTFKRFSGLMVQLLHKLKIRSADGQEMLLKVVKNPISRHIPAGAHVIGERFSL